MKNTYIIADVGSNYDGSLELAQKYVEAAKKCGADAVKFQTLRKDKLIAPRIYIDGKLVDNPVYQKFTNLELPDEWHYSLKQTAEKYDVEFISTPFYIEAVDLLEDIGVKIYKIASGDITFLPLLEAVGRTEKRVILSTGASSLADVEQAVNVLNRSGAGEIVLLHCVSNYPAKVEEMNLRAMVTMKDTFGLPVGISDHTLGNIVPIVAVSLGATVIEKHITFDRSLQGPDHPSSTTVEEFKEMVQQIRLIEQALGTGKKVPSEAELTKQHRLRRGIYDPTTLEPVSESCGLRLRPEHAEPKS